MAATDGQITVAAARWSDEGHYLREFIAKHRLPAVVKIIKGQYGNLGVPTLPSPGLQSTALLVSAGRHHKIIAQAVKIKEGRRLASVGPRLVIPDTYGGYFELLSEEGRAVRCIESVAELARRRPEEGCLVRETIRAVQARHAPDGTVTPEGARTVPAGEVLVPNGETALPGSKGRYLKCVDAAGDTLLLGMEQRGKFSPLAREDNISGVHTARNLLSKRLPLTVRLVHGTAPRGLKSPNHFVPELRLLSAVEEEHVFALPLQKETQHVTALPLAAPLKLLRTRNDDQIRTTVEFERLVERATRLIGDVAHRIHVLEGKLGDPKKASPTHNDAAVAVVGYVLRRSASSDSAAVQKRGKPHHHHHHHHHRKEETKAGVTAPAPPPIISKDYDEIDQIYDYVRGFAPLPKTLRQPTYETVTVVAASPTPSDRPEPPPIETIPTKKFQAEKRQRRNGGGGGVGGGVGGGGTTSTPPGLPKLYVKNGQRGRLLRQKSASPMKETPPSPVVSKSGSPLFNIRYKSLSNLQQAMDLDGGGTLDSSNSGGRVSGDSGGGIGGGIIIGGVKQPEKRSRKLSRPRSLTNLVWEMRDGGDVTMPPPPAPAAAPIVEKSKKCDDRAPTGVVYRKHSKYAVVNGGGGGGGGRHHGTLYL